MPLRRHSADEEQRCREMFRPGGGLELGPWRRAVLEQMARIGRTHRPRSTAPAKPQKSSFRISTHFLRPSFVKPSVEECDVAKRKSEIANRVYVFKVALAGRKNVWRRVAVRASQTLDHLHEAIFDAFDRYDEHLYSFYFPKPGAKGRNRLRDAVEYSHPYMREEPDPFGEVPRSAAKARLSTLGLKPGQVFLYLFDFGDQWWHEITVEQTDAVPEKGKYPRVLQRHGPSPPQYPDVDDGE